MSNCVCQSSVDTGLVAHRWLVSVKAHDEAIDLSSVAAFKKTYAPILVRTMDKNDTLRYGTSLGYEFSPPHRLLAAAVGAKNRADFKADREALDPKLVDCNGFPDCESALRFWLLQLRLRKMLNTVARATAQEAAPPRSLLRRRRRRRGDRRRLRRDQL